MPLRFDEGTLGKFERTPSGGVVVPAYITRTGVLLYRTQNGVRRELRLPEDVFHPESLASLANAPVTDRHPPELVNPENHRTYARGHTSGAGVPDGERVAAQLVITDADLIGKIERGDAVEVSAGYTCTHEETSGVYNGEPYDCIQRNVRYNHNAVGPRGWNRAGREIALRMDDGAGVLHEPEIKAPRRGENPVKHIPKIEIDVKKRSMRIDGVEYRLRSVEERALATHALSSAMKRVKDMSRFDAMDLATAQAAASDMMSTIESLQAQAMALVEGLTEPVADADKPAEEKPATEEEKPVMDAKEMDRRVNERVKLIERAKSLHPKVKIDGRTDLEIMLETIEHVNKGTKLDGDDAKDPSFVRGTFAALRASTQLRAVADRIVGNEQERADADDSDPAEKARQKNAAALRDKWKPTAASK